MSFSIDRFSKRTSSAERKKRLPAFLFVALLILPVILTAAFTCYQFFSYLQDFTFARRVTMASLVASTVKERLDRVVDVGISLASRLQFQKLVASGNWDEAIDIMRLVPEKFPYIDRVSLFDEQGVLRAVTDPTPELLSVIGKDFSYRDYYQGVSKDWTPYIGEAIKPAVPLGYNLVPVAIPVRSESGSVSGMILLLVKLDTISAWAKSIEVGPGGFVFVVDQKGHLLAHPTLLPADDIVDFSSVPAVQKALVEDPGVDVNFNQVENEERLAAWARVPGYGWGVVVTQPTRTAFVERDKAVGLFASIWSLVIVIIAFLSYVLLRDKNRIRLQRDKEHLLLASIGDGVVSIDLDWNITQWNAAATRITGWSIEDAIGKPFRSVVKFILESDRSENVLFISDAMLSGEIRYIDTNTLLVRKDGTEIPIGDSASPIRGEDGSISGAVVVFRDASKEREAMSLRSDFTYAAHQLRTPVTKAMWSVEVAMSEEERPEIRKRIEDAYFALKSVVRLNDQLLLVSQIDQGLVHPDVKLVDMTLFLADLLKGVDIQARAHNVKLDVTPVPTGLRIVTDAELLRRTLEELCDNAIMYSAERGTVHIAAIERDGGALIEVRNVGIGILPEQQPLVFTKFFRGSNYDTTRIIGAGLGLYISRQYLERLGGKIWFTSVEGGETVFSLFLPGGGKGATDTASRTKPSRRRG